MYFVAGMPIGYEQIHPAVVVVIQEFCAEPAEKKPSGIKVRSRSDVVEGAVAIVMEKLLRFRVKVDGEKLGEAISIQICCIYTHAMQGFSTLTVSDPGSFRHLRECAIVVVAK